jgi:TM2 domain-containing membrane protein YozV
VPAPPAPGYAPPPPPPAVAADKSKVAAGVFGILLGSLAVHKFYLGYTKEGIIMLAVSVVSFGFLAGIVGIVGLVEGILYLTKTDDEFYSTYVAGRKAWF